MTDTIDNYDCNMNSYKSKKLEESSQMKRHFKLVLMMVLSLLLATSIIPVSAAKKLEIPVVVKIIGIPWFNQFEVGVKEAAEKFGVNSYQVGPTQADPAQQVKIVEDLIAKGVDAIVVVPNDANALEPVFKKAKSKGIPVIVHESPSQKGADWDVETIDNNAFAIRNFEKLAELTGGKGEFALFVGGLTVPLHNLWADTGLAYIKKKYPGLKLVTDRIPSGENAELSRAKTLELLQAYPNLKAIISFGSLGPIGAAQALREKGLAGKVAVLGNLIPSQGAQYLKDDSISYGFLWDPKDSAYSAVYVAKQVAEKKKITAGIKIPGLAAPAAVDQKNKIIRFNAIIDINKANVDSYKF
jgi:simple sugar transport system substrate-binding protein